jgi:hypothetical protein
MPRTPLSEITEVLSELDTLLKNPDVGAELSARGINISLALVAAEGVRQYLTGDRMKAAVEFQMVAEEIQARHALLQGASTEPS